MKHISRSSFTLIEMLIVIVIIGILAAALVPRLQAIQWRARDSERKVDLRTIYTAAQVYYTDVGDFPAAHGLSGACAVDAVCSTLSYGWPNRLLWFTWYMTSYPLDPLNIVVNNSELGWPWFAGNYVYRYWNVKKNYSWHLWSYCTIRKYERFRQMWGETISCMVIWHVTIIMVLRLFISIVWVFTRF